MIPSPLSVAVSAAWQNCSCDGTGEDAGEGLWLDLRTEADVDVQTADAEHSAIRTRGNGLSQRIRQMGPRGRGEARLQIGRRRVVARGEAAYGQAPDCDARHMLPP